MEKENSQKKTVKKIPEAISVGEFAHILNLPVARVVAELMLKNGVMATINEYIDFETAAIIGEYLGFVIEKERVRKRRKKSCLTSRYPEIFRSALYSGRFGACRSWKDLVAGCYQRKTNVVAKESGGITQHIGSYQVDKGGRKITFLDTPGHAAFEKMREHGAQITDIVLIIISADDGVKPQTIEAINHAKKSQNPVIVVITKIDKPEADVQRILSQVSEIGLTPEEWGGKIPVAKVSSKTKEGIDDLLDLILLVADVTEYKADPDAAGVGVVVESHLDHGQGPVATVLVKNGTLRIGDYISVGDTYGKIRSMENYLGKRIKEAGPSAPVLIAGIKNVPQVADLIQVFGSEKEAKEESQNIKRNKSIHKLASIKKRGLEELSASMAKSGQKEMPIVIKADVKGSLQAVKEAFDSFANDEVSVKVIEEGIGDISENDISMAKASDALVVGFNVHVPAVINQLAKREKVQVLTYKVIYELLDDVKNALSDLLEPEIHEITIGKMEVLKIFTRGKDKMIVGGKVKEGKLEKNVQAKVVRGDAEIGRANVTMIKKEKDEVREVQIGNECGISLDKNIEISEGDIVEEFRVETIKEVFDE
jgi:translation initiation factor IF-2